MGKRLILFRHAKSGWDDSVARDFDRPLNKRGWRAAQIMGHYARENQLEIDHIIASPATRVIQTLEGFAKGYGVMPEAHFERRVYLSSGVNLIDIIHTAPDSSTNLLLAGHNPGLEDMIFDLIPADNSSPLRDQVEEKYPTATLALLDFGIDKWSELSNAHGQFAAFWRPRDVDPSLGPVPSQ